MGSLSAAGYWFAPMDHAVRSGLFGVVGTIVAVVGSPVVAGLLGRPHRGTTVDPARGFFRLWFANRAYTEAMARLWAAPQTHALAIPNAYLEQLAAEARGSIAPVPPYATPAMPIAA